MTNRVITWKSLLCFAVFTAALNNSSPARTQATPPPPPPSGGIGQEAEAEAAAALDLLNNGKLPEAEQAYSALLQKYPTSGVAPEALFRLGSIQYLQEDYESATATLNRIVSPPATPQIKTAADALIAQVLETKASKMSPVDPDRKQAFEDAIKQFDAFIQKYPDSPEVESSNYGRAMAAYQIGDFDSATKSLQDNLQRFSNSDSILNSEDLLAVLLTSQASGILKAHGDTAAAFAKFNQAIGYLANIIERRSDVALSNDAQFQIGEVLYDRAGAEKDAKRASDLTHAIAAYRAVKPQDTLIQEQQQRVAMVLARVRQAAAGNNALALSQMQKVQDRENAKLESLKHAPDQTINAQMRIASSYFLLQKYDEARVLMHYLQPFVQDPGQKKQIAYYLVLTYASQGIMDKAETAYNDFQSAYKGDPIGENLPLVMGEAFMTGKNSQPNKAAKYLDEERELYPNSPFVSDALNQQAAALVGLHRYDEALDTYDKFLATKPPPEQAAEAQRGIAAIYQQTGKLAQAVKQYQMVADLYPGTPMAEQNSFYAAGLETTVDVKQALPLLQAFVSKYPNSKFDEQATMMIGQVQAAEGDTEGALQTYKSIPAKYPNTDLAPQAYFQQAALLANSRRTDEMVAVLREFLNAYPDNKNIFYAYDTIGQTQTSKGKMGDAIATYTEMVDKHADDPMAPMALYRVADLWRKIAVSQGQYSALSEDQRNVWNKAIAGSIAASEQMLEKFPDSDQVGVTLKTLLADEQMLLDAKQKTPDDIDKYFHSLAEKFSSNPSAKSRIIFTLATFTYQKNPVMGVAQMGVAYNPAFVYAPADLDLYGSALIDQGKADEAFKVYEKIAKDYSIPAGLRPAQAQPAIQEAQAIALYGEATALAKEGKTADAGKLFAELKASYPWSPKVVEADFGIAKSLVQQNKADEASKLLVAIVGSRSAPAALRAHAFLLIGQIQENKGNVDAAIDSYLKTAAYYGGVEDAAAEGLWRGGQMLEKQAASLSEQSNPKKSDQIAKAVSAYKDIGLKYPDSQFVPQAEDRLKALGAG